MKPLNEKLQKGVRAVVFALVATASVGAALAMKPADRDPSYTYGVTDNNDGINWKVQANVSDPESNYRCLQASTTCTVTYESQDPLSPNDLILKDDAENAIPGQFTMP